MEEWRQTLEEWRDIPGYEGYYQISDEGNVISLKRCTQDAIDRGVRAVKQGLRFQINNHGQYGVTLCRQGVPVRYQVHVLVLLAFVGPKPEGMEGRHEDKDYANNRLDNLRWSPVSERKQSVRSPRKLTAEQVEAIRVDPDSQRKIAARYGVSQPLVHTIKAGKTWRDMR